MVEKVQPHFLISINKAIKKNVWKVDPSSPYKTAIFHPEVLTNQIQYYPAFFQTKVEVLKFVVLARSLPEIDYMDPFVLTKKFSEQIREIITRVPTIINLIFE